MRQTLRLLSIDFRDAPPAAREAFAQRYEELDALCARVSGAQGKVELVALGHGDRLELYTTEASHRAVFRAVLGEILSRLPAEARSSVRAVESFGVAAAWHLMQVTLGFGEHSGLHMLRDLNAAVARARRAGTFGPELAALFQCALEAGWRIQTETALGDPVSSAVAREVDHLEAERIIEEELVTWQAARASHGVSQSIPSPRADSAYAAAEPGSAVRVKVAHLRDMGARPVLSARRA